MHWRLSKKKRRKILVFWLPLVILTNFLFFVIFKQPRKYLTEDDIILSEQDLARDDNILLAKNLTSDSASQTRFQNDLVANSGNSASELAGQEESEQERKLRRTNFHGKVSSLMEKVFEPLLKVSNEPTDDSMSGRTGEDVDSNHRSLSPEDLAGMPPSSLSNDAELSGGGESFLEIRREKDLEGRFSSLSQGTAWTEEVETGILPVQENPWVDVDDETPDPLSEFPHSEMIAPGSGCTFRQFDNHSVYSKPEFADEYLAYKSCSSSSSEEGEASEMGLLHKWLSQRIWAKTGKWGELRLRTSFQFLAEPSTMPLCSSPDGSDAPTVLYAVLSRSGRHHLRDGIRDSWGAALPRGHRAVFFVGDGAEDVSAEAAAHGDLVRTEVAEEGAEEAPSFATKQLSSVLAWVFGACQLVRFVAVVSDRSFVNARRFQMFADMEMNSANRLYGNLLKRMEPDRDPGGPHHISEEEWPWKHFPPFLQEKSFIISGDVLPRLLVGARLLRPLPLPQVFLTGLVPLVNRIMRIGVAEFFQTNLEPLDGGDECHWAQHGVIEGVTDPQEMQSVFSQVDHLQRVRNVTCTIHTSCSVRIDGKCMIKSAAAGAAKKKKKKD